VHSYSPIYSTGALGNKVTQPISFFLG